MSKINKDFGYLGYSFQLKLIFQIIQDKKFGENIIEVLDPVYFDNQYFRLIISLIREYFDKYEGTPSFDGLDQMIKSSVKDETLEFVLDILKEIKNQNNEDYKWVQDKTAKFCKQQEIKKAHTKIGQLLKAGDEDKFDHVEEILRKALEIGAEVDEGIDVFHQLDDVLSSDFRHPIPTGIRGLDNLMMGGLSKGELGLFIAPLGIGKAQPLTSKILTPNGWKLMGEIKVGDDVIGSDGKSQKVLGVFPQGERPVYKVEFDDGVEVKCDGSHLWAVNSINQRNRKTRKNGKIVYTRDYSYKPLTTFEILKNIKVRGQLNYRIPVVEPIDHYGNHHKIDPYILGVLLGDGSFTKSNSTPLVSTKDVEIIHESKKYANVTLSEYSKYKGDGDILTKQNIFVIRFLGYKELLKQLNLYGCDSFNKFIPKDYLFDSKVNRISLLQGLLDTDGSVTKKGCIEFSTSSKQLSEDVKNLVLSLGGFCRMTSRIPRFWYGGTHKYGALSYRLTISFPNYGFDLFRVKRKQSRVVYRKKYAKSKFINNITYIGKEQAQCIVVSNKDHLYVTDNYILTHNSTFLTKIANSAYNAGNIVLQIVFEDNPKVIQRKHISCWTGIELNELPNHKDEIIEVMRQIKERPGRLIIHKFPSYGVTMGRIKALIKRLHSRGVKPDIVLLDYIECVLPENNKGEEWISEGRIMRQFESMANDFDFVAWVASQGNRSSISADIVTTDKMGGNIKKAQIGHFIVSAAKSLQQKELGLATVAVLKSRFGKDGVVFKNCTFDNSRMIIDTEESLTFLGFDEEHKNETQSKSLMRIREVLDNKFFKNNENDSGRN